MLKDEGSAVEVTANLGLELEELMYLSGSAKASKKLQKIYDDAQKLLDERRDKTEEPAFFKAPAPSVDDKQRTLSCPVRIGEDENETQKETQKETPVGKSETSDSQLVEDSQKTLIKVFDTPPEILEKKETSGKILPDNPKPAENNFFSFLSPLPEKEILYESIEKKATPIPSKKKDLANSEPSKQSILDKASPSAGMQDSTVEVLKKAEPKNQKTLFDF
jgi:replication factor C large subunit